MQTILVTGGCGYIGSLMTKKLAELGYNIVVFDSMEHGDPTILERIKSLYPKVSLYFEKGDVKKKWQIDKVFKKYNIDAVMHFAAYIEAGESMLVPTKYFENNTVGSINLIKSIIENKVLKFVLSSTAGVYGNSVKSPIIESSSLNPENYYGLSKVMVEKVLEAAVKEGLNSIRLRYFNAAGASLDGLFGEKHKPESHLIPRVIQYALKQRDDFKLFGDDYPTPDGTCVRDYIHIEDLVEAHQLALNYLEEFEGTNVFNLGTGKGISNKEIIDLIKKANKKSFEFETVERREGDPAVLFADSSKAQKILGWKARYNIEDIVNSAYKWHKNNKPL